METGDLFQELLAEYRRSHGEPGTPEDFVEWARKMMVEHPLRGASSDPGGKVVFTLPDGRQCLLSSHGAKPKPPTGPIFNNNAFQKVY